MTVALDYDALRADTVRQVAKLMAASAITAPKSGGQLFLQGKHLFIETVIVDDHDTLSQLAGWLRARGKERREAIWFRDADVAEAIDAVLFVGLADWYPPNYDCGACGYATCAEFLHATKALRDDSAELEFAGPTCNLRDIDLGIAVGSAAKTAAIHSIDCRCQTRIAVAARKLGVIHADIAVGLSLSLTHKAVGFDRRIDPVDFDTLDLPATGTLPIGIDGAPRAGGARNRQQPRTRDPAAAQPLTVRSPVVAGRGVGVGAVVAARVDVDVDVVEVADLVEQVVAYGLGHVVALADRQVFIDHDGDRRRQAVPDPAGLHRTHPLHPVHMRGGVLDRRDDRRVDGVHQPVEHLAGGAAQHGEDGDRDDQPDDRVGPLEPEPHADGAERHGQRGEPVGAGVVAVGLQRRRPDPAADPDPVQGDELVAGEADQPGQEQPPMLVIGRGWISRSIACQAAITADRAIMAITNTPARSSARR